ncbi:MAG: GFA family protein [Oleiphilaceae bacterium]|nr:GFA family protein [Oleiphilaceae bacterium]
MLKGSCLCQSIQYEYTGELDEVAVCHCHQCKRAQGTPFVTNAPIHTARFRYTSGTENLKEYFSSPNKRRVFCGQCGSPLFSQRTDMPDIIRLRLGTVTQGHIPEPHYEIYCASRSAWFKADSQRLHYEQNKA